MDRGASGGPGEPLDEHRLGLKPITGKQWAPRGKRPIVRVQHRYEWLYLYAFACPESGASQYWLVPEVNVTAFQLVLDAFARSVGVGPDKYVDKYVLLVLDGAGWHTSGTLSVPEGLELVFLPPNSPELQPAERLWALTDVALKNKHFAFLSDLHATLAATCQTLERCPDQVRAHTLFHWWPRLSLSRNYSESVSDSTQVGPCCLRCEGGDAISAAGRGWAFESRPCP